MASSFLKFCTAPLALAFLPGFLSGCGSSDSTDSTTSTPSPTTSPQAEPARGVFITYPGYTGSYDITDHGGSAFDAHIWYPGRVTLFWQLQGIPMKCTKPGNSSNSCAIHISEGTTCLDASMVGDDYYNSTISYNPWVASVYTAKKVDGSTTPDDGEAQEQTQLTIGIHDNDDIVGRAMVVYDYEGHRIACGLIGEKAASHLSV